MSTVNVHEAKTGLSALLASVEHGGEVVIARHGKPVARLVAYSAPEKRVRGSWGDLPGWAGFTLDPAVLAPMSDAELQDEGWI